MDTGKIANEHANTFAKKGPLTFPRIASSLWNGPVNVKRDLYQVGPGETCQKMEVHSRPKIGEEACERAICRCLQISSQAGTPQYHVSPVIPPWSWLVQNPFSLDRPGLCRGDTSWLQNLWQVKGDCRRPTLAFSLGSKELWRAYAFLHRKINPRTSKVHRISLPG